MTTPMDVVLITGMSGSGKSVALNALEDSRYYCVDNLPPELLTSLIELEQQHHAQHIAVAIDVRSATSLPMLPSQLQLLDERGLRIKRLFLDASTQTLVQRFSETRRRHPLSSKGTTDQQRALAEAIELERELLSDLREQSHVVDTSMLRSAQLQAYVKALISAPPAQLTLVFESFAFKRGVPADADYVFDVRMLPNPHYEPSLRALTGRDAAVQAFLQQEHSVAQMQDHIQRFLEHWLGALASNHRSYVTVAIGCTGGQHRSVYLVEELAAHFAGAWPTLKRHRELDALR